MYIARVEPLLGCVWRKSSTWLHFFVVFSADQFCFYNAQLQIRTMKNEPCLTKFIHSLLEWMFYKNNLCRSHSIIVFRSLWHATQTIKPKITSHMMPVGLRVFYLQALQSVILLLQLLYKFLTVCLLCTWVTLPWFFWSHNMTVFIFLWRLNLMLGSNGNILPASCLKPKKCCRQAAALF